MKSEQNYLLKSLILIGFYLITICSCQKDNNTSEESTVTDVDGNVYHTVTIGTQTWLKENLKVTHYRNGEAIPVETDNILWCKLKSGAYCDYDNNFDNSGIYGRLYNWYAVHDSNNIAPSGWHIPDVTEWQTLASFLGGNDIAGGKMKEANYIHWMNPNNGATNESGFTALPAGMRHAENGAFMSKGAMTMLWSSYQDDLTSANNLYLGYSFPDATNAYIHLNTGLSVRCIKD
jgi:uncharacterized protein (TIGR02145 family)